MNHSIPGLPQEISAAAEAIAKGRIPSLVAYAEDTLLSILKQQILPGKMQLLEQQMLQKHQDEQEVNKALSKLKALHPEEFFTPDEQKVAQAAFYLAIIKEIQNCLKDLNNPEGPVNSYAE